MKMLLPIQNGLGWKRLPMELPMYSCSEKSQAMIFRWSKTCGYENITFQARGKKNSTEILLVILVKKFVFGILGQIVLEVLL
jgi:hypothetical protein